MSRDPSRPTSHTAAVVETAGARAPGSAGSRSSAPVARYATVTPAGLRYATTERAMSGLSSGPGPEATARVVPVTRSRASTSKLPRESSAYTTYRPSMAGSVWSPGPEAIQVNVPTGVALAAQGATSASASAAMWLRVSKLPPKWISEDIAAPCHAQPTRAAAEHRRVRKGVMPRTYTRGGALRRGARRFVRGRPRSPSSIFSHRTVGSTMLHRTCRCRTTRAVSRPTRRSNRRKALVFASLSFIVWAGWFVTRPDSHAYRDSLSWRVH